MKVITDKQRKKFLIGIVKDYALGMIEYFAYPTDDMWTFGFIDGETAKWFKLPERMVDVLMSRRSE